MVLTLYKINRSPPVRSVLMVIELLKIPDVNYVDVNLAEKEHLKEEYVKINPQHTVPMLKDDDFYIWDSHAIAVYLVNKYGKDSSLYPTDIRQRAIVDQRLHFDSGVLFATLSQLVEPVFIKGENAFRPEHIEKIKSTYNFVEKFLASSQWLAGDKLTVADICCLATISSMNLAVPIDKNTFPKLSDWLKRLAQQEFYKKCNEPGLNEIRAILKMKLKD